MIQREAVNRNLYPRIFIMLVYIPSYSAFSSGYWLGLVPNIIAPV